MQSTYKLWQGKSLYDSKLIMAIITNLLRKSENPKTGHMAQLWILPTLEPPYVAIKSGLDSSVCGDCILALSKAKLARANGRKIPSCYVGRRSYQAPTSIWKTTIDIPVLLKEGLNAIKESKYSIRYGAYGDIAMLPEELIQLIKDVSPPKHTAYTHQPHRVWAQHLKNIAMASVHNLYDANLFQSLG